MTRLTPGLLAEAAASKALNHEDDLKRAAAFEARGLGNKDDLTKAILAAWADRSTEWNAQPGGGIQWMNREQGLVGAINLKEPHRGTVFSCTDEKKLARRANSMCRTGDDRGILRETLPRGPVPVGRAIREREFRDNIASMPHRRFGDLVHDGRDPARDEYLRDERTR